MLRSYSTNRPAYVDPGFEPALNAPARARLSPAGLPARIASGDRVISTAGRIVRLSETGATVEVMFPSRGPSVIMLYLLDDSQIYESEVRWRTDARIGVRFLDILGPVRRRLFFSDQPVPLQRLPNRILRPADAPQDFDPPEPSHPAAESRPQRPVIVGFRKRASAAPR